SGAPSAAPAATTSRSGRPGSRRCPSVRSTSRASQWTSDGAPSISATSGRRAPSSGSMPTDRCRSFLRSPRTPAPRGPGWGAPLAGPTLDGAVIHYGEDEPPRTIGLTLDQAKLDRVSDAAAPIGFSVAATLETGGRVAVSGQVVRSPGAVTARIRADD